VYLRIGLILARGVGHALRPNAVFYDVVLRVHFVTPGRRGLAPMQSAALSRLQSRYRAGRSMPAHPAIDRRAPLQRTRRSPIRPRRSRLEEGTGEATPKEAAAVETMLCAAYDMVVLIAEAGGKRKTFVRRGFTMAAVSILIEASSMDARSGLR